MRYSQVLPPSNARKYKVLIWTVCNLLRRSPRSRPECVPPLEMFLLKALLLTNTEETIEDIAWALSYSSEYTENIKLYTQEVMEKIIALCKHQRIEMYSPALSILGNVTWKLEDSWVMLCNLDVINTIIINSENPRVRRKVFFVCSKLCGESQQAVDALINANFFSIALKIIEIGDCEIVKEILWTLASAVNNCTLAQAEAFIGRGWVQRLLLLFPRAPSESQSILLESINSLFRVCPTRCCSQFSKEIERFSELNDLSEGTMVLVHKLIENISQFQISLSIGNIKFLSEL